MMVLTFVLPARSEPRVLIFRTQHQRDMYAKGKIGAEFRMTLTNTPFSAALTITNPPTKVRTAIQLSVIELLTSSSCKCALRAVYSSSHRVQAAPSYSIGPLIRHSRCIRPWAVRHPPLGIGSSRNSPQLLVILVLRIHAMYDCNMLLLRILLALLAIQVSTELIVIGPLVARMKSMCRSLPCCMRAVSDRHAAVIRLPPGFDFPGCLPENVSSSQWTYWIPSALFELTLVLLAARKLIQVARTRNRAPRILAVLLRDSVIYFGGIFATILCTLVTWTSARVSSVCAGICAQP